MGIKIERVKLRRLRMPLVHFFETSFGRTYEREIILAEVFSDGLTGWGEVTCGEHPFYNEEWTDAAWLLLRDYAIPRVLHYELESAESVAGRLSHIRGHNMARGGLEAAVWDLEARRNGVPLWKQIGGGARREIPCGVSIGIQDSVPQLIEKIRTEVDAGYQRIKMKIKPGWDVDVIRQVREAFAKLGKRDQDVITLCVLEELTTAQAAEALGVPEGTVKSRLSRARARLTELASPLAAPDTDSTIFEGGAR